MKKILSILLIGFIMFLPMNAYAQEKEYKTLNLDEALTQEEIEHDFSNYKENDKQVVIYLFRGNGCAYCKKFLNFLNSIVDDYGKYFKVVSYEVWYDQDNAKLMKEVANFMGESADGVPFIIIGDKVFAGYIESFDDQIKAKIKEEYENKDKYDVIKEMKKVKKEESKSSQTDTADIVILNLVFLTLATTIIIIFNSSKNREVQQKLDELQDQISNLKTKEKGKKKVEE